MPWKECWGLESGEMGFCPESRYNHEQVISPLRASGFSASCESVFPLVLDSACHGRPTLPACLGCEGQNYKVLTRLSLHENAAVLLLGNCFCAVGNLKVRNAPCGPMLAGAVPLVAAQACSLLAVRAGEALIPKPLSVVHPLSRKALPGLSVASLWLNATCGLWNCATMLILLLLILQWMIKPLVSDPGISCVLSIPKQLCEAILLTYALVLLLAFFCSCQTY